MKKLFEEFNEDTLMARGLLSKLQNADLTVKNKKQVIALKYFETGKLSDSEYQRLVDGGAKGFSTFMSYFILSAIASRIAGLAFLSVKIACFLTVSLIP